MRLDISKYNVIYNKNEEGFIGYEKDILRLYKDYMRQLVDDEMYDCDEIQLVLNHIKDLKLISEDTLIHTYFDNFDNMYRIDVVSCEV